MADSSVKVAKMARILAIMHIILGLFLVYFGIAERDVDYFWTDHGYFGIWIGVWMCVTGSLGIPGTGREQSTCRCVFAGVFMGFSITSAVFGGIIISAYNSAITLYRDNYYDYEYHRYLKKNSKYDADMTLSVIILIIGVVEFIIGIWVAVCVCLMNPCTCCHSVTSQQGQVMNTVSAGYVVTQVPGGAPVAFPMQGDCGMFAVQNVTPRPLEGQAQMVLVPVSETVGNQASGVMATGYQPEQCGMLSSYAKRTDSCEDLNGRASSMEIW